MRSKVVASTFVLAMAMLMTACSDSSDDENETRTSKIGSTASHNAGQDCLQCHKSGGQGEGVFSIAGTVYQSGSLTQIKPNVKIEVHTGAAAGGNLVISLEVDARGNFYTGQAINWTPGLFVSVTSDAETRHMFSAVTTGACNHCHGVTETVINVN